jgi:glycosyltransferase involved in cell wall biosynthesis
MKKPRLTIGVPVYHGRALVVDALQGLARQTCDDFRVLISVDGQDDESADVCRPFLADRRFELVIHPSRLGWAGNVNWLSSQAGSEFFAYHGQDDKVDPSYYATLMEQADSHPDAAVVYTDLQWFGARSGIQAQKEIHGVPVQRMQEQLRRCLWLPFLGLRRTQVTAHLPPLAINAADSALEDVVWVTRLLLQGSVLRVPLPLYAKRLHPGMTSTGWARTWTPEKLRSAWLDAWLRLFAAAAESAKSEADEFVLLVAALERLAVRSPDFDWFFDLSGLVAADRRRLAVDFVRQLAERGKSQNGRLPSRAIRAVFGDPRSWAMIEARARFSLKDCPQLFGWHDEEQFAGVGRGHWSGPGARADIPLRVVLDRPLLVRVAIARVAPGLRPEQVQLIENGRRLPTFIRRSKALYFRRVKPLYLAEAEIEPDPHRRSLRLAIEVPYTVRPIDAGVNEDRRALGCAVGWIEIEPHRFERRGGR